MPAVSLADVKLSRLLRQRIEKAVLLGRTGWKPGSLHEALGTATLNQP
jgi:hypothetical protein